MSDTFLDKILVATAKMRDQKGERVLSEKAKAISDSFGPSNDWQRTLGAFKIMMGDEWYETQRSGYKPVKFAVVRIIDRQHLTLIVGELTCSMASAITSNGEHWNIGYGTVTPATDKEIRQWYTEFLKASE